MSDDLFEKLYRQIEQANDRGDVYADAYFELTSLVYKNGSKRLRDQMQKLIDRTNERREAVTTKYDPVQAVPAAVEGVAR